MIGYLEGKIKDKRDGKIILLTNGVGFEITCSASVYDNLCLGKEGEVYVYTAVREDDISLYGFISLEEKEMFLKLISVSGVGPKMGITVLSNMALDKLVLAIATSDVKGLSQIKGLGKKTAERIILELREKISSVDVKTGEIIVETETVEDVNQDAVIALMSLGFTKQECVSVIKQAKQNGANSIEELIAYSLKHIK